MKRRTRKLTLQTETLRHLQAEDLEKAHGGTYISCAFTCLCQPTVSNQACSNIACEE